MCVFNRNIIGKCFLMGLLIAFGACSKKIRTGNDGNNNGNNNGNQTPNNTQVISCQANLPSSFLSGFQHSFWLNSDTAQIEYNCTHSENDTLTVECSLDGASYAPCNSSLTTVTNLSEGRHNFRVKATDTTNRSAESNVVSWGVDTVDPTVNYTGGASEFYVTSVNQKPVFNFVSIDDPTQAPSSADISGLKNTQCQILGQTGWQDCSDPFPALANGNYTFQIQAFDNAGNDNVIQTENFVHQSTTIPGSCAINTSIPTYSISTSQTIAFGCQDQLGINNAECRLDGGVWNSCGSCVGFQCDTSTLLTGLSEGNHLFEVRYRDSTNQPSAAASTTWTVDTEAPIVSAHPSQNPILTGISASIPFQIIDRGASGVDQTSVMCRLSGPTVANPIYQGCTSPFNVNSNLQAGGNYSVEVIASDMAGNQTQPGQVPEEIYTYSWTVPSSVPPSCQVTSNHVNYSGSNTQTVTYNCSAPLGVALPECRVVGPGASGIYYNCDSISQDQFASLSTGTYNFWIKPKDIVGNEGSEVGPIEIKVDRDAPTLQVTNVNNNINPTAEIDVNANDTGGSNLERIECTLQGPGVAAHGWMPCDNQTYNGTRTFTYTGLVQNANYIFQARAYDAAGNPSLLVSTSFVSTTPTLTQPICEINPGFFPAPVSSATTNLSFSLVNAVPSQFQYRTYFDGVEQTSGWTVSPSGSLVVTNPNNGNISVQLRCVDTANVTNIGPTDSVSYNVDTTAPTLSISNPYFDYTSTDAPWALVGFTFSDNGTVNSSGVMCKYDVTGTATDSMDWHVCTSPLNVPQGGDYGAAVQVSVKVSDSVGNTQEQMISWNNDQWSFANSICSNVCGGYTYAQCDNAGSANGKQCWGLAPQGSCGQGPKTNLHISHRNFGSFIDYKTITHYEPGWTAYVNNQSGRTFTQSGENRKRLYSCYNSATQDYYLAFNCGNQVDTATQMYGWDYPAPGSIQLYKIVSPSQHTFYKLNTGKDPIPSAHRPSSTVSDAGIWVCP